MKQLFAIISKNIAVFKSQMRLWIGVLFFSLAILVAYGELIAEAWLLLSISMILITGFLTDQMLVAIQRQIGESFPKIKRSCIPSVLICYSIPLFLIIVSALLHARDKAIIAFGTGMLGVILFFNAELNSAKKVLLAYFENSRELKES